MTPSTETEVLLGELLESDSWVTALDVIGTTLAVARTDLMHAARGAFEVDMVGLNTARAQARIDGIVDVIYAVYKKANVEVPQYVESVLARTGKLR